MPSPVPRNLFLVGLSWDLNIRNWLKFPGDFNCSPGCKVVVLNYLSRSVKAILLLLFQMKLQQYPHVSIIHFYSLYFSEVSNNSWHKHIIFKQLVIASEILNDYLNIKGFLFSVSSTPSVEEIQRKFHEDFLVYNYVSHKRNALLTFLKKIQKNTFNVNKWLEEAEVQIDLWDHLFQYFSKCGLQPTCIRCLLKCRFWGPIPDLLHQSLQDWSLRTTFQMRPHMILMYTDEL